VKTQGCLACIVFIAITQDATSVVGNIEDLLLVCRIPGDAVIVRPYQVQLALADSKLGMADFAAGAIGTWDFLEPCDDVATRQLPWPAIKRPAAKLPLIAVKNAVIGGCNVGRQLRALLDGCQHIASNARSRLQGVSETDDFIWWKNRDN